MKHFYCLVASIVVMSLPANSMASINRPPLNPWRLGGEFAGGLVGYLPASMLGYLVGAAASGNGVHVNPEGNQAGRTVSYVAAVFTVSAGVYWVGDIGNETGSYWATVLGTLLGIVPTSIAYEASRRSAEGPSEILAIATLITPVIGAMVGFNLTRSYESNTAHLLDSSLLRLARNSKMTTSIPLPRLAFNQKSFEVSTHLFEAHF